MGKPAKHYQVQAAMAFWVPVTALALAGCGGGGNSGAGDTPTAGIKGQLILKTEGPLPGSTPTTSPYVGGKVVVLNAGGTKTVAMATSGDGGDFQVTVPPGSYQVQASGFDDDPPQAVTVPSSGYAQVSVTGYRLLP